MALAGAALGCSDGSRSSLPATGELADVVDHLRLTPVVDGLDRPTFITALPGSDVLLVLEQGGRVRWIEGGQLRAEPFLDLSDRVLSGGGEQGLLGLAFHPNFRDNGRFFVHYSTIAQNGAQNGLRAGDGVISEFTSSAGASSADASTQRRLLSVAQPYSNHNGGMLAFSPRDGFLYIGLGDGGSGGDPRGNGQNLGVWLGKMLRIDVDSRAQGEYGIPDGNLSGSGVLPEIWSYGLRNPWRFSFDPDNGDLYIGDVGQNAVEEVDYEPRGEGGRNYGWNTMEGSRCYQPNSGCDRDGIAAPVLEYSHDAGCSITGGYVYRGRAIPELRGVYFYADYCSGLIGTLRMQDGALGGSRDITASINPDGISDFTSFGTDADGELYIASRGGSIYRIEAD
ncbi:MAG TPA: PQQ-dependent sugar dehydrogenase [Polyangiaceae bacterium]|nr:PQQ-dependent sugar dehydrogenase [Polyangiaceae bacterium]